MKKTLIFCLLLKMSFVFAQLTYVPDDNFEQALIDLGYDDVLDDYVLTANIDGVSSLNVSDKNISDLTGIDSFAALTVLYCRNNQLSNLDITNNLALTGLNCENNQLSSLDISQNTALTDLSCGWNQLPNLDVTHNPALESLNCNSNQLTSLDVSQNLTLEQLGCQVNELTTLDVNQNTAIIYLWCFENQLSNLNVSQNTALTWLSCEDNQIDRLDLSQNLGLRTLACYDNQLIFLNIKNGNNLLIQAMLAYNNPSLTCIQVDNENAQHSCYYPYQGWCKDEWAEYSENCPPIGIVELTNPLQVELFPNPVTDILYIDNNSTSYIESKQVYDVLGKLVIEVEGDLNQLDISNLPSGVLFVKIEFDYGIITKKIIKI